MCGITGIVALRRGQAPNQAQLRAMCETIVHRGPDDEGMHIAGNVGFAMRRLSVIDLSGGQQPIFNEDQTVWAVFNGEIYNYRELRKTLECQGHVFRTDSDTEVIVHAYEEYGSAFCDRLNGMFAIALYDSKENRFLLIRDHLGIKPIYYSRTDEYFVFGSEIKALLASGLVTRDLDFDALSDFLTWEYVPRERTLLSSVRKLEPGHFLEINLNTEQQAIHQFWDIPLPGSTIIDDGDYAGQLDSKITECGHKMHSHIPRTHAQ